MLSLSYWMFLHTHIVNRLLRTSAIGTHHRITRVSFVHSPGHIVKPCKLSCCCTASMEQAANGAETAAIDGLISSWSETISVWFCLRAPGYGLTLWCALSLRVVGAIQVHQLQLHVHLLVFPTNKKHNICPATQCSHLSLDGHCWLDDVRSAWPVKK